MALADIMHKYSLNRWWINTVLRYPSAYHNFLPDNVQKLITTRKSHYNTRNSYNSNFLKFCVRTNLRQMSISYRGINVWNKLDPEVKCATSVSDFKNKFKTQLLGNYIKE